MHGNKKFNSYDLTGDFGIGYTNKNEEFFFDIEDYDIIKDHCWYIESGGRVCARRDNNKTPLKFHRVVMGALNEKIEVDHIDRNQTNNRKSNLRLCSHNQNLKNTKIAKTNTSGYKGVWYRKDTLKYTARIECDKRQINLGCFDTLEDALIARLTAEKELFGNYSSQHELFKKYSL